MSADYDLAQISALEQPEKKFMYDWFPADEKYDCRYTQQRLFLKKVGYLQNGFNYFLKSISCK